MNVKTPDANTPGANPEGISAVVTQLRELAEQATPGPWRSDRFFWKIKSEYLPDGWWLGIYTSVEGLETQVAQLPEWPASDPEPNARLIVAAVNAFPALLDHCDDVLRRHEPVYYVQQGCGSCGEALGWPCPDYLSISRLLESLTTFGDPKVTPAAQLEEKKAE